ncbi:MAG: histidine phosphatase family protein [Firmicutes bacterium]|nr:histidine phosphatase family protein [Bacillota bacterium]
MSLSTKKPITELCLVRHGQSVWNAERRVQGQSDPQLSPLGLRQAKLVARRLQEESWSALYSSDLSRAKRTAEIIAKHTGLTVRTSSGLRERCQGKRTGLLFQEAQERYPDPDAPEVGRETEEALLRRAKKAYAQIRDAHQGQRVIVVAHGLLMGIFLKTILEPLEELSMENTACTLLTWDGENWGCAYLADASHLKGLEQGEGLPRTGSR